MPFRTVIESRTGPSESLSVVRALERGPTPGRRPNPTERGKKGTAASSAAATGPPKQPGSWRVAKKLRCGSIPASEDPDRFRN